MSRDRDYEWRKYFTCPRCFSKNARVVIILAKKDSPSTPPSWLPEDFVYPEDSCDPAVGLVCEDNHLFLSKEPYFARAKESNSKGNAGRFYILCYCWEFEEGSDDYSTIFLTFVDEAVRIMVKYCEADPINEFVRSMLRNDYKSEVSRSNFVDSSIGSSVSSKWATNSEFTSVSKQRPRNFKHSPRSSGDRSQREALESWLEDNNNIAINDISAERPLRDTDSRSSFTCYSDLEEPALSEESDNDSESESDPIAIVTNR
ncbi:Oidioi.mRNA.OKI2018_I69.PAR.g11572.t1.cds [Oikopleura dioica]|uniref:Oidioi.mRNA.OKI2018_I69.PAR.g11572.t1.cds n=1 Tax=Oikopleura dioica TaxID=34765 RepID=A0ABN7S238_OIKDI|nr:Oidioi.mRNA.OKI2018_I69.PAR.g11572.t1.cds [Oikopleura dioica]